MTSRCRVRSQYSSSGVCRSCGRKPLTPSSGKDVACHHWSQANCLGLDASDEFEDLVWDLYKRKWGDPHAQRNGRSGQFQAGVDIFGQPAYLQGRYAAVQCKRYEDDTLTEARVKEGVAKAETFKPALAEYIIATSERLDATLQKKARLINGDRQKANKFPVHIAFWDDLRLALTDPENRDLLQKYYAQFFIDLEPLHIRPTRDVGNVGDDYRRRLRDNTKDLRVFALDAVLPIQDAWNRWRVPESSRHVAGAATSRKQQDDAIEAWLRRYNEWERLAGGDDDLSPTFEGEKLAGYARHAVLIGGPGTGKSSALKRLAHHLANQGDLVLYVRLPLLDKVWQEAGQFDTALLRVAIDRLGIAEHEAAEALKRPDYLLADGLDECDPRRAVIAKALTEWAESHSQSKVIVATRPAGHESTYFPGWAHVEMARLTGRDIKYIASRLIATRLASSPEQEQQLERFERQLGENRMASLAAGQPLLLGFLVALSIGGTDVGQNRAELYRRVLDQLYARQLEDREAPATTPPAGKARFILDSAGWHLLHTPTLSRHELVAIVGKDVAHEYDRNLAPAKDDTDTGLAFWEQYGIVDRVSIAGIDRLTFVHQSLEEYTAGCHAAQLPSDQRRAWLDTVRKQPRWREVILLATGSGAVDGIVERLLQLDDPDDPTSTDAVLAAAALTEIEDPPAALVEQVADQLRLRLTSSIPLIVLESAAAALGLARLAPAVVGPIAQSLLGNEQPWSRLAAVHLSLACGDSYASSYAVVQLLEDMIARHASAPREVFVHAPWGLDGAARFEQETALSAMQYLMRMRPDEATHDLVGRVVSGHIIMVGYEPSLRKLLGKYHYDDILEERYKGLASATRSWQGRTTELELSRRADRRFLESVLRAMAGKRSAATPSQAASRLTAISSLVHGMCWLKAPKYAWLLLAKPDDADAVDAVVQGAIAALGIEPDDLATDARWASENLDALHANDYHRGLLHRAYETPQEPTWHAATRSIVDTANLVRALEHPSPTIAQNAAQLLVDGYGHSDIAGPLRNALATNNEETLRLLALMAPYVWHDDALNVILDRLTPPMTKGCHYLLSALPQLSGAAEAPRIVEILGQALLEDDAQIVEAAAGALLTLERSRIAHLVKIFRQVMDTWTERDIRQGTREEIVSADSGMQIYRVLPSPRAALARVLAMLNAYGPSELEKLCSDTSDEVRDVAIETVVMNARDDPERLADLLDKVETAALPIAVLSAFLVLPGDCLQLCQDKLVTLCKSGSSSIRRMILQSLPGATWLDRDVAQSLAREAVGADDEIVRNQATETLRALFAV